MKSLEEKDKSKYSCYAKTRRKEPTRLSQWINKEYGNKNCDRTVDNSLITGRIEYSTFLNLPLDECIVNTPPETKEVIK